MKTSYVIIAVATLILCLVVGGAFFLITRMNQAPVNTTITTTPNPQSTESNTNSTTTNTNNGTSATTGACTILTPEIAAQVLKTAVKSSDSTSSTSCTYTNSDASVDNLGVLTISINSPGGKDGFEVAKSTAYGSNIETVTDLKNVDSAYWAPGLMQLSILKGDIWTIISGTSSLNTDTKQMTIDAAKLAGF